MLEITERSLPPVLAAMTAMDEAVAARKLLAERLASAAKEAERLDEELRRVDADDHDALVAAAQKFAFAVTLVQRLARREERARLDVQRAQIRLEEVRQADRRAFLERMRIELEIDAATIWDMVGLFEAQLHERLEDHARLAAEVEFAARAAGERQVAMATWTPALQSSGPDFWNALANGVRQLQANGGPPAAAKRPAQVQPDVIETAIRSVVGQRVDVKPEIVRARPAPAPKPVRANSPPPVTARARLERALRALSRNP